MSVLHLLWIVPLSTTIGYLLCGLVTANDQKRWE